MSHNRSTEIISLAARRNGAVVTVAEFTAVATDPCFAAVFISAAGVHTIVSDCHDSALNAETTARQIAEQLNAHFAGHVVTELRGGH